MISSGIYSIEFQQTIRKVKNWSTFILFFFGKILEKLNQNANFWNLLPVALNININTQNE